MIDGGIDKPGHALRSLVFDAIKRYGSGPLLALLSDKSALVRSMAARELQGRGESIAFDKARELLRSTKSVEREIAAFLLGQLGYPAMPFKQASVPLLEAALREDRSAAVRAAAAAALGHLRAASALEHLLAAAQDPLPEVRVAVAFALGKFRRNRRAAECLKTLAKDDDECVREWASL